MSYCASCDSALFRGRPVLVVGGGDWAADEALVVAEHASRVVLVVPEAQLSAAAMTAKRVMSHERIVLRTYTEPVEIFGEARVAGVRLRDVRDGAEAELAVDGVFACSGLEPNTGLLTGLVELDAAGHVATDAWMETTAAGVFAAGDIRRDSPRQLVNVASDGATAAISAHRYLTDRAR